MNAILTPTPSPTAGTSLDGMASLDHLGVLRVSGEDAAKFLHGQLTQDFALLGPDQARLAAFCSAKGRMLASFIGFKRSPQEILLVCSRDLLATTHKRLQMFVLRAKVRIEDASAEFALRGLAGSAVLRPEGLADAPWALGRVGEACVVNLYPALGAPRQLWLAPVEAPLPQAASMEAGRWLWGEVRSGVATLSQPLAEAFVPQMLNYESVGGVNFKKGCYPGQEVVARSQFRGTLKRRAFVAHCEAALAPGQEIFHSADGEQDAGLVVQAAAAPGGGFDAIVALQLAAVEAGSLHVGESGGPALALLPLPYALLQDI